MSKDGKTATGVTYVDANGVETVQPADLVLLCAFQFHNVRLMLVSGIGKPYDPASGEGVVGTQLRLPDHGHRDAVLRGASGSTRSPAPARWA